MEGTYLLAGLVALLLIVWPEETTAVLTSASFKAQLYLLNLRTKWAAWRIYRQLVRMSKGAGLPHPGPFSYKNLWDRD